MEDFTDSTGYGRQGDFVRINLGNAILGNGCQQRINSSTYLKMRKENRMQHDLVRDSGNGCWSFIPT